MAKGERAMRIWRTIFGIGAVAGAAALAAAAMKKVDELADAPDEHWIDVTDAFDGDVDYPDMAERPTVYSGSGPIVYPPCDDAAGEDPVSAVMNEDVVDPEDAPVPAEKDDFAD